MLLPPQVFAFVLAHSWESSLELATILGQESVWASVSPFFRSRFQKGRLEVEDLPQETRVFGQLNFL